MKNVVHLDYIHNTNLILDIYFNGRNYFFETSSTSESMQFQMQHMCLLKIRLSE